MKGNKRMNKYGKNVEIIHGTHIGELESKVSAWLKGDGININILKILQSESSEGLTISIFYDYIKEITDET